MSDLLDRLNTWRVSCGRPDLCGEAIAEIERLKVRNAELLAILSETLEGYIATEYFESKIVERARRIVNAKVEGK